MSTTSPSAPADRRRSTSRRLGLAGDPVLAVDRVACSGHGVCAQLLDGVTLDEWGYPVVVEARVDGDDPVALEALAAAVRLCPARALYRR
ncbi:ferredoxin [Terrabacter sp. NPDC000476]|uniref:ferredoxin n=1 Tax=Terrabacter sp. NPDC000476 TaxID=3154258 RepID=UPI00332DC986